MPLNAQLNFSQSLARDVRPSIVAYGSYWTVLIQGARTNICQRTSGRDGANCHAFSLLDISGDSNNNTGIHSEQTIPKKVIPMRFGTISWLSIGMILGIAYPSHADQWGHWRGPLGNGVAIDANPPIEFGADKNLRWKVAIPGRGSASPVVWGKQVFVSTAVAVPGSDRLAFQLICLDRATGQPVWAKTAVEAKPHDKSHETNGYASASPCTDGLHVYAHFGSQGLFCYTMTGDLVWKRDFGDMRVRNGFGEGSSPTIAEEMIIVPWDHEQNSKLFALNKKTGETIWETARSDEPSCWATPHIAVDANGQKQVVMNGQTAIRGYDLKSGRELWKCAGQAQRPCSSATSMDGFAIVGSGFKGNYMGAFDLRGKGDLANTKNVLWSTTNDTPDVASPLLSGGRLYFYKEKTGLLTCLDAKTGKVHFATQRIPGVSRTYASPVAAAGFVYLTDRNGSITVIEDSPTLKVVATNTMGEGVDATPAIADDEIFIRGESHLFCIGKK